MFFFFPRANADYILPNITEACLLTGTEFRKEYDKDYKLNISVSSMRSEIYALEHDSRERQKDLGTLNYDLDRLKKIQYYINYADEHSDALRALPKFKKTALQKEVDEILQQKKQPQQQTTTQAKRSKPSL